MLGGEADGSPVVAGIGNQVVNTRRIQLRTHQGKLSLGQFCLQIHLGYRRFFWEENPAHGFNRFIAEDGKSSSVLECDIPQGGAAIPDLIHRKASAVQRQLRTDQVVIDLKMEYRLHFRRLRLLWRSNVRLYIRRIIFLGLRLIFGALHILPFGSFPLGNLLFQFKQIILRHPLRIEVSRHAVLIHIEAVMQIIPDAVAFICFNDSEAFIRFDLTLRGNLFRLRQHPIGLGKEASVIYQNPQLTLNFCPRQFQRSMVGDNGKGIRTAEFILQPCGSSALPSMCQHIVVDTGFAFKAAIPANQGIADFIGCDRLRHSSRFRNRLLNRFGRRFFLHRFFRFREFRFIVHPRIGILLLLGEVPVFPDKGGDVLGNLRPVHLHRGTSAFGQPDALGAVIFGGMVSPGQRMRAPADAVLLLQEVRFFLHGVVCGKICVDSALATFHGAAACKRFADFILSNKALRFCKFGKPVRIYPALGRDVPDSLPQLVHPVIMKAQKFSVFRVIIQKSQKFAAKRIGKSAVLHLLRKRCGGVRITGRKIIHGGEIACLVCFITQVMFQIEQALCQFGTDTLTGFGKLHIGSKAAFF